MNYSVCIITNGKRIGKLTRLIGSINLQRFPEYEIIVCGLLPDEMIWRPFRFIECDGASRGKLGLLRNTAARMAKYDHLLILDDDMFLHADFYPGLMKFGEDYDLLSCKILNPDGSRFWDWNIHNNGDYLMDYTETSPLVSLTGGFTLMKKEVFERVQWSETLGFYEMEDVDFTERVKREGFSIKFNPLSTVTHDAPYTQCGNGVRRL